MARWSTSTSAYDDRHDDETDKHSERSSEGRRISMTPSFNVNAEGNVVESIITKEYYVGVLDSEKVRDERDVMAMILKVGEMYPQGIPIHVLQWINYLMGTTRTMWESGII